MRLTASPAGVDAGFWGRMGVKKAAFATRQYGFDQFIVGLLIALLGIGIMVGGFLMDRIRRRFSENGLAALGGLLMGASYLALIPKWSFIIF